MAGSGIRGQFEEKFKALLRDIEEEVRCSSLLGSRRTYPSVVKGRKVICFIDEVRTCYSLFVFDLN